MSWASVYGSTHTAETPSNTMHVDKPTAANPINSMETMSKKTPNDGVVDPVELPSPAKGIPSPAKGTPSPAKGTAASGAPSKADIAARDGGWPVGKDSGSYLARNYSIAEMPIFSPPGAIISLRNLPPGTRSYPHLSILLSHCQDEHLVS